MRLLTFNCSAIPLLTASVPARLARLAERVRTLDPDVACFQEVGLASHARLLTSRLVYRHSYWKPRWGGLVEGGLVVLSKAAPARASMTLFREQGRWLGASYISRVAGKGFMLLEWDAPRWTLVHAHAMADLGGAEYARLQASHAEELAWAAAAAPGRAVVAGDLNAPPGSAAVARLSALGLEDLLRGSTEPSMVPEERFPAPWGIPRRLERLDHVLARGPLSPSERASFVLDEPEEIGGSRTSLSDHRGLLAELTL